METITLSWGTVATIIMALAVQVILQSRWVSRKLEDLHDRINGMQGVYVSKEDFNRHVDRLELDFNKHLDRVEKAVAQLQAEHRNQGRHVDSRLDMIITLLAQHKKDIIAKCGPARIDEEDGE